MVAKLLVLVLVPLLVGLVGGWATANVGGIAPADLAGPAFMVLLSGIWVSILGGRAFRSRTLGVLAVAVLLLYGGYWAGLWQVLSPGEAAFVRVRDVALAVGMATATVGLVLWLRDTQDAYAALSSQEEEFRRLSMTDSLTGLFNSKAFFDVLDREVGRARRYGRNLSLAFLDIDNFKSFNDENGHLEGDRLLREVGRIIQAECRENDAAFRYGGEEFTIVFPETDIQQALVVADRIREHVERTKMRLRSGETDGRTVSIGVAMISPQDRSIKELIDRADKAMYAGKLQGKNVVLSA